MASIRGTLLERGRDVGYEAEIAEFDAEVARGDRSREKHEVNATDLGVSTDQLRESKRAERMRQARAKLEKAGTWEGPSHRFEILLGVSHPWDGPGAVMVEYPDGGKQCRGCGCYERLPASTVCLHCNRSGVDHWKGVRGTRPKPADPKPEVKCPGPATRKERRRLQTA